MNCPAESWVLPSEGWDWEFFLNLHWDLFCSVSQNHEEKHHSHFRPRRINIKNVGNLDIRLQFGFWRKKIQKFCWKSTSKRIQLLAKFCGEFEVSLNYIFSMVFRHYFFYNFLFMIFFITYSAEQYFEFITGDELWNAGITHRGRKRWRIN